MPPADRFNPGQKFLFWGFFWSGLLLLLTGLILWFPHWIPWNLRFLRTTSVFVHAAAALLTIGLFIVHVYMGAVLEEGALEAVVRGDVSRVWAKKHHGIRLTKSHETTRRGMKNDKWEARIRRANHLDSPQLVASEGFLFYGRIVSISEVALRRNRTAQVALCYAWGMAGSVIRI